MRTITFKTTFKIISKWFRRMLYALGIAFFLMLMLSFTDLPFWGVYHLANTHSEKRFKPDYIVVMSGNGVPSPSALMRTYYAWKVSKKFPKATIVIACTEKVYDNGIQDSTAILMVEELKTRGVSNPIIFEKEGTNTRSQALKTAQLIGTEHHKLLIVTSPEHVYRAVSSFEKVGFQQVRGCPSFEKDVQIPLSFDADSLGGSVLVPDVGNNEKVRYKFWMYWIYQIKLLREYTAIAYYKLQGWV